MTVDLDALQPSFRPIVERLLRIARSELSIDVRVLETTRSFDRQRTLLASGASKERIGKHNFGYAVDVGIFFGGEYQKDDRLGLYLKCGFIGMALGARWGGNWDQDTNIAEPGEHDLGHFEDATVKLGDLIAHAKQRGLLPLEA